MTSKKNGQFVAEKAKLNPRAVGRDSFNSSKYLKIPISRRKYQHFDLKILSENLISRQSNKFLRKYRKLSFMLIFKFNIMKHVWKKSVQTRSSLINHTYTV